MVMETPVVSVIVPTRGRPALAAACVRGVLAQRGAPPFELIVADQTEGTTTRDAVLAEAAGDARIRHVPISGRGRSRALNGALPEARGAWIVMTDDDCLPSPDWLALLAKAAFDAPPRSIVVGRVVAGPREDGRGEPPSILDLPAPRAIAGRVDRDWIHPNVIVPRALFDEIGAFDERMGIGTPLPGGEDNDFGYRLLRAGWTILYRPEPVVIHAAWRTVAERAALKKAYGLGQGAFYAKHLARADAFVAWRLAKDVVRTMRAAAGAYLRGRRDEGRGHAAYGAGLLAGVFRMTGRMVLGERAEAGR
jgi:glycosyltransferase involved in cell wall biosynthesis